jgi:hypothetical protein
MLSSHHQNVGQIHNIKRAKRSFEKCPRLKYLGMLVKNKNLISGEFKSILNLGNACCH